MQNTAIKTIISGGINPPEEKNRSYEQWKKLLFIQTVQKILIVGNAINTDLLCEYIHIVYGIPYPKINFSYGIENAENKIIAMTLYKNRFHFCKRFLIHPLARREYRKYVHLISIMRWSH